VAQVVSTWGFIGLQVSNKFIAGLESPAYSERNDIE